MGSNANKWDEFYAKLDPGMPQHYIDTDTYTLGKEFLADCEVIEDWGCGKGWFAYVCGDKRIISIDGSLSPFADKVVDLEDYYSSADGIFMRHVAEHNYEWKKILQNLLDSFVSKAFVVFYTPMAETDDAVVRQTSPGWNNIPEISIPSSVWEEMIKESGAVFESETIPSDTAYGEETFYKLQKI